MNGSPFSRSALMLVLAAAVGLFALSVLLHAYDDKPVATSGRAKPGSYSVSAIGHAGIYEVLERLGYQVKRGTGDSMSLVGQHGTLILAEPERHFMDSDDELMIISAPHLLLILPKWGGSADRAKPAWIAEAWPVPLSTARSVLGLINGKAEVLRAPWPAEWQTNELKIKPSGMGTVQLIRSDEFRPVVGDKEGILVGEIIVRDRTIWVLADPDVISNQGLAVGETAAFSVRLIETLSAKSGRTNPPIVFDESVHGFVQADTTPIKLLFRFPFAVVTWLGLATAFLVVLAGTRRFGVPQAAKPELDFGKAQLISNSARLLDYAGHHAMVLKRYIGMTVHNTGQSLHAPAGLEEAELARWLDRVGTARGVELSCADILNNMYNLNTGDNSDLTRLFDLVRDIHRWKGEILDGSSRSRRTGH